MGAVPVVVPPNCAAARGGAAKLSIVLATNAATPILRVVAVLARAAAIGNLRKFWIVEAAVDGETRKHDHIMLHPQS